MSKKALLWVWLLILIIFMFFCIKAKVTDFLPHRDIQNVQSTQKSVVQEVHKVVDISQNKSQIDSLSSVSNKKTKDLKSVVDNKTDIQKVVEKEIKKKKDIIFKIDKSLDELNIDGVLNSKDDFINLKSKYKNLTSRNLKYDKKASNPKVLDLILNLSDIMKRLKSGYLEYHDNILTVDGVVASKSDKKLIDSTLGSISEFDVNSNIVVEKPKTKVEHIGKLSITKQGDLVTISGIFSSEKEIEELIKLLKSKNLDVKKELCIVDSDLKEDRWKIPFVLVLDDFVQFDKGTIQFDKDTFSVIGKTQIKGIKEDIQDRLSKEKNDDLILISDITYTLPKPTKQELQERINAILKLKSVRFKTATGELIPESKKVLDEVANILLENPNIKVEIAGHTDSDGEAKTNLILSQHRADTVKKYLVKRGVNAKNLKAVGYGEGKPLVKNSSEENKQINRRVEFIILGE